MDKSTKILFMASDVYGCGHYRVFNPATMLKKAGYNVAAISPKVPASAVPEIIKEHDLIIYQRPCSTAVNDVVFGSGKPILIDTDDMVDLLTPENPAYAYYKNGSDGIAAYSDALKAAKGIINSTSYLASHNSKYNPNNEVVENYIDASLRQWWPRTIYLDDYIRIGWAGSTSHNEDIIESIIAASNVAARYPQVRLLLMSNMDMVHKLIGQYCNPKAYSKIDIVRPVDFADYPNWLNWDIGLAPIKNTEFNRAKSPLKFMEYSVKTCATIASPIQPYIETMREGMGLFAHGNSINDWEEQIDWAVTHIEDMCEMSVAAYEHVCDNYLLERNWHKWVEAVDRLLADDGNSQAKKLGKVGRNELCPCGSGKKWKRCHGQSYSNIKTG